MNEHLTAEQARALFDLDLESGILRWRITKSGVTCGAIAGSFNCDGYRKVIVNGVAYSEHRLIWLHAYGCWPTNQLDHINGERADNRPSNLREATPSQNTANRRGVKGVTLHRSGKYQAQIKWRGRSHYLGLYATEAEARAAYLSASRRLHGEFGAAA